ncbi:MAG: monovalent cation:proton antiporter-2 (CPA2) family protein [Thiolinea sp.]
MTPYLIQAFIYLCAAVIAVPLAKRLGLGSVLGYLIAGVIIGPVSGLVGSETQSLQHFAEFGVVMMLFLVGLELEPRNLWGMRHRLLGLGGLQVGLTMGTIFLFSLMAGLEWRTALVVGMILSLSSTAIVLQTLNEKGLQKSEGGRSAFSVLLFQDIAVIPMLALIPLLEIPWLVELINATSQSAPDTHHGPDFFADLPNWGYTLVVIGAIAGVILAGHFLSHPLFNFVAGARLREIFTATSLMLVIGIAALMDIVGLSPALGTFIAGVVLANSEFRHELEANIEPFKGLLLGLFFITVGAGINFATLSENLWVVLGLTAGIIVLKAAILYLLALIFKVHGSDRWLLTLSLAQAGEFGFVLISFTVQRFVLPTPIAEIMALVVALSMFLTPILFILLEKVLMPRFQQQQNELPPDDIDEHGTVIIAGIGRFGQIVHRLLIANQIPATVLDYSTNALHNLRQVGIKAYYGDPTRTELLETAGIADAAMLVIAIDGKEQSVTLVEEIKKQYPDLPVLVRAYDEIHRFQLKYAGADIVIKETYDSALRAGGETLKTLGFHAFQAEKMTRAFAATENANSEELYQTWLDTEDDEDKILTLRTHFMKLEARLVEAIRHDRSDGHSLSERGWTPPPKEFTREPDDQPR